MMPTKAAGVQAGPTHQGAVHVRAPEQGFGVLLGDRSSVLDAHLSCRIRHRQHRPTVSRIHWHASWASSGVAAWPVPMAHIGS